MTAGNTAQLVALVTHARDVPLDKRERFAAAARPWSARRGGIVLETCHRVEAYAVRTDHLPAEIPRLPAGARVLLDESAVRHAVAVAVGLDSVVVGEDQILHQLRGAIGAARDARALDPTVERLFIVALRAGRRARSWREAPPRSIADVAIGAIERRTGSLRGRSLLAVGAGQMGALAARAGLTAGADVAIASRTRSHAQALARQLDVRSLQFDPGRAVADFGAVIVALRGPWSLSGATGQALRTGAAVVVDLSTPRAFADDLVAALGDRFIGGDALVFLESEEARLGRRVTTRVDKLIDGAATEFLSWREAHQRRAAANALTELADAEREAELAQLWRRLPHLDVEARDAIEGMSRHFANRLLREPLERLARDHDGRAERAARELFGL